MQAITSARLAPVASTTVAPSARRAVAAKASPRVEKLVGGVVAGTGALMASPLVAEAAVTPSLQNFINSIFAGGFVVAAIAAAVVGVANFDPVDRR